MPDLINDIGQNYRRAFASSNFGTRAMQFYGVVIAPTKQSGALPFNVTFLDNTYTNLYVGSNSYLTFGNGSDVFNTSDDPTILDGLPGIIMSCSDNSYQFVYSLLTGNPGSFEYRIRYEGSDSTQAASNGPNLIWEIVFYENKPGIIDLIIVKDLHSQSTNIGICGITDGTDWQDGRPDHTVPWGIGSWRIDASGATATITAGEAIEHGPEKMLVEHMFNHDTGNPSGNFEEDDSYVLVTGLVWSSSDYSLAVRAIQQVAELYFLGNPDIGMGLTFTIGVSDNTVTYQQISDALNNANIMNMVFPMTVGPESIYIA